jgi:prevent-host-death family protein
MPYTRTVSFVKAHLAEVIHEVNESHQPVVVTQSGANAAVIQDHESFQRTRDALVMLKLVAMGEADASRGRTVPQAQVFRSLKKRLKARLARAKKRGRE